MSHRTTMIEEVCRLCWEAGHRTHAWLGNRCERHGNQHDTIKLLGDEPVDVTMLADWTPDPDRIARAGERVSDPPYCVANTRLMECHWTAWDGVHDHRAIFVAKGVRFVQPPTDLGSVITAVFDDTCGSLVQITEEKRQRGT